MCLLIITHHSHCGHNTYHYGTCEGQAAHHQCLQRQTELGTLHVKCSACDRWADLARRTREERNAWVYKRDMALAIKAERERRRTWEALGGRTIDPFGNGAQFDTCGSDQRLKASWFE